MEAQRERTTWISKLLPKAAPSSALFDVNSGVTSSWADIIGSWADGKHGITEIQMSALAKGDPWGDTARVDLAWPQSRVFLVTSTSAVTWASTCTQGKSSQECVLWDIYTQTLHKGFSFWQKRAAALGNRKHTWEGGGCTPFIWVCLCTAPVLWQWEMVGQPRACLSWKNKSSAKPGQANSLTEDQFNIQRSQSTNWDIVPNFSLVPVLLEQARPGTLRMPLIC